MKTRPKRRYPSRDQAIMAWRKKRRKERREYFKANPGSEQAWRALLEQLNVYRGGGKL
jgi:hypothetical protein